jgi:hypothetical protein
MFSKTKKYSISVGPTNSPTGETSGSRRSNTSSPNFFQRAIERAKGKFTGSRPLTPENSTLTPDEQEELMDIRAQAEEELEIGRNVRDQFYKKWKEQNGNKPMTLEDIEEQKRLVRDALPNINSGGKTRKGKRRKSKSQKRRDSRKRMRKSKRSRR